MIAKIFKEDKTKPLMQGDLLATINVKETPSEHIRHTVNTTINDLRDYYFKLHKCSLIVAIND